MQRMDIVEIIGRKRYSTHTATLIADDRYWDGHNLERGGRNTYLYRTPKGAFFVVNQTMWVHEQNSLVPVSLERAIELWEGPLKNRHVDFDEAFPDIDVEDA